MSRRSLDSFKPVLKEGHLKMQGSLLLYEVNNPVRHLFLPVEMADVLTLCNGNNTVREIVEKIYRKQKTVRFRETLDFILHLKKRGFFENGSELKLNETGLEQSSWLVKVIDFFGNTLVVTVTEKISIRHSIQSLFPVVALIILGSGLYFGLNMLADFRIENSFRVQNSYLLGLGFFYAVFSVLMSVKSLCKAALLLLATGTVYDLKFRITPIFTGISVSSESVKRLQDLSIKTLYYLASLSSYLILMPLTSFILDDPYLSMSASLATLLLLCYELNPIGRGELRDWLDSASGVDSRSPWYLVQHEPGVSENVRSGYNYLFKWVNEAYTLCWGLFCSLFLAVLTYKNLPYLRYAMNDHILGAETLASTYVFSMMAVGNVTFVYLFCLGVKHRYWPMIRSTYSTTLAGWRTLNRAPTISKEKTHEELLKLPILSWFNENELQSLLKKSRFISLQMGQVIFDEQQSADHLMVLLSGQIQMQSTIDSSSARKKAWKLLPVTIFGEESLLVDSRRESKAVATKLSTIVEIPVREVERLIDEAHYQIQFQSFRTAIMLNQYFHSAPIFSELSEESINFMMAKGILEEATAGETIFAQGTASTSFYLLIKGSVKVILNGEWVNVIPQGGFFGEIGVIADIPRTATIEADSDCVLFKIGADDFWEVLTQRLEMAVFIEAVGEFRLKSEMRTVSRQKLKKIAS